MRGEVGLGLGRISDFLGFFLFLVSEFLEDNGKLCVNRYRLVGNVFLF